MPKTKHLLIVVVLLATAVSAAGILARLAPSAAAPPEAATGGAQLDTPTGKAAVQSGARPGEVIPLTLRARGFDPEEVTRPAGAYLVAVDNRSGLPELSVRLDRENEGRVRDVAMKEGRGRWREVIHLTPGRYTMTVASHPEWVCRITVTPR